MSLHWSPHPESRRTGSQSLSPLLNGADSAAGIEGMGCGGGLPPSLPPVRAEGTLRARFPRGAREHPCRTFSQAFMVHSWAWAQSCPWCEPGQGSRPHAPDPCPLNTISFRVESDEIHRDTSVERRAGRPPWPDERGWVPRPGNRGGGCWGGELGRWPGGRPGARAVQDASTLFLEGVGAPP